MVVLNSSNHYKKYLWLPDFLNTLHVTLYGMFMLCGKGKEIQITKKSPWHSEQP